MTKSPNKAKGKDNMFQGFSEKTLQYFETVTVHNSKVYFNEHREEYDRFVKAPLTALFTDLSETIQAIDPALCTRPARCISTPYTDARFSSGTPLKAYMYLRFRLLSGRRENLPGFFFDSSYDDVRYGLRIYDLNSGGMEKIRESILANDKEFLKACGNLKDSIIVICGEEFKRDHYPEQDAWHKEWLNRKTLSFSYTSPITKSYFTADLGREIADTFQLLTGTYGFIKGALNN